MQGILAVEGFVIQPSSLSMDIAHVCQSLRSAFHRWKTNPRCCRCPVGRLPALQVLRCSHGNRHSISCEWASVNRLRMTGRNSPPNTHTRLCRQIVIFRYPSLGPSCRSVSNLLNSSIGSMIAIRLIILKGGPPKLLLELLRNTTHITEFFIFREILSHDPTTVDSSPKSEWQFDNRNRTLWNGRGVQDYNLGEQFVSSISNGNQVSISLGG